MKKIIPVLILLLLAGCTKKDDVLNDFGKEKWASDPFGCLGHRNVAVQALYSQKERIKGQSADYLVEHLGSPDETDIVNRQQKFYRYFLASPEKCGSSSESFLQFRINSVNLIDEMIWVK